MKRSQLNKVGKSPTAVIKKEIQALLRDLVILRDKGCVVGRVRRCGNDVFNPNAVYQAEHLIERSNSITYGDSRLVVCVCKNCHFWKHIKKSNHDEYDAIIRTLISLERVRVWDLAEQNRFKPNRMDWVLVKLALEAELAKLSTPQF